MLNRALLYLALMLGVFSTIAHAETFRLKEAGPDSKKYLCRIDVYDTDPQSEYPLVNLMYLFYLDEAVISRNGEFVSLEDTISENTLNGIYYNLKHTVGKDQMWVYREPFPELTLHYERSPLNQIRNIRIQGTLPGLDEDSPIGLFMAELTNPSLMMVLPEGELALHQSIHMTLPFRIPALDGQPGVDNIDIRLLNNKLEKYGRTLCDISASHVCSNCGPTYTIMHGNTTITKNIKNMGTTMKCIAYYDPDNGEFIYVQARIELDYYPKDYPADRPMKTTIC